MTEAKVATTVPVQPPDDPGPASDEAIADLVDAEDYFAFWNRLKEWNRMIVERDAAAK
jgi:hypothetical protein